MSTHLVRDFCRPQFRFIEDTLFLFTFAVTNCQLARRSLDRRLRVLNRSKEIQITPCRNCTTTFFSASGLEKTTLLPVKPSVSIMYRAASGRT